MNGDHAGRRVVGMDLHRHRSVLVRTTEDGRELGTSRIVNSPAALRAELAGAGENGGDGPRTRPRWRHPSYCRLASRRDDRLS